MAQSPQDWARKLTQTIQQQGRRGGFGGGGGPPKLPGLGAAAGIVLLLGGGFVVNNALFNGPSSCGPIRNPVINKKSSGRWSSSYQVHKNRRRPKGYIQ